MELQGLAEHMMYGDSRAAVVISIGMWPMSSLHLGIKVSCLFIFLKKSAVCLQFGLGPHAVQ